MERLSVIKTLSVFACVSLSVVVLLKYKHSKKTNDLK